MPVQGGGHGRRPRPSLLTYHPVPIPHKRIRRMIAVHRRNAVLAGLGAGDAAVAVVVVQDQSITLCLRACFLRTPAPPAARPETQCLPVPKGSKTALRTLPVRSNFADAALFPTFGRFGPDRCHFGLNWAKRAAPIAGRTALRADRPPGREPGAAPGRRQRQPDGRQAQDRNRTPAADRL